MNDFTYEELTTLIVMAIHIKNDYAGMRETADDMLKKLIDVRNALRDMPHKKPTIGLFGNETQNQIHKDMMDGIYERLGRIERFLNLMGDE